jgi:hypothetical protein
MGSTQNTFSVVDRMDRFGHLDCVAVNDETQGRCMLKLANSSYLDYTWEGCVQRPVSAAALAVSWWPGDGDTASDPFDADTFLELLSRLSGDTEERDTEEPLSKRKPATAYFVGEATARQQSISLCCLLRAGLTATGSLNSVNVTARHPFACQVVRRDPIPGANTCLAQMYFIRCNRGDSLLPKEGRSMQRNPVLNPELAKVIAMTPDVLVVNLGAWSFQYGCNDRKSLHDAFCSGTRPWILHEYALQWALLAGALNQAYSPWKRRHSLVLLRTTSPSDFEFPLR